MPLLAQLNQFSPPVETAAWLAVLLFLVMLFNACSKAWFTLRGKPSPLETQAATYALARRVETIESCIVNCKHEQDRRLDNLENSQREMSRHIGAEIDKVFNRVNATATAVDTTVGELTIIKQQLTLLITHNYGARK